MTKPAQAYSALNPTNLPLNTVITGMPYDEYARIDAIRSTHLKAAAKSVQHFQHTLAQNRSGTPAMMVGRLAHLAVLEPAEFAKIDPARFTRQPERTAYAHAQGIAASIWHNATASALIRSGRQYCESVVLWRDKTTDRLCKVRFDVAGEQMEYDDAPEGFVLDLKTCRDSSPHKFARDCAELGYAAQISHYLAASDAAGLTCPGEGKFYILAVENTPPYGMRLYTMHQWYGLGDLSVKLAMQNIVAADSGKLAPVYPEAEQELVCPPWVPEPAISGPLSGA